VRGPRIDFSKMETRYATWLTLLPVLYDYAVTQRSKTPCISCTWLQHLPSSFIIGTDSPENNKFIVCDFIAPSVDQKANVSVSSTIDAAANVRRIRQMPKNHSVLAGFVCKVSQKPLIQILELVDGKISCKTQLSSGHSKAGYGLSWNEFGRLASGSEDGSVCVWDCKRGGLVQHWSSDDAVNDVQFRSSDELVCVDENGQALFFDLRSTNVSSVSQVCTLGLNCVSAQNNLFAFGSVDRSIYVYDRREMGKGAVNVLEYHNESILQVLWHPSITNVLAASSEDGIVSIWRQDRLVFVHAGHTDAVYDLSWNPSKQNPFCILSVALVSMHLEKRTRVCLTTYN